MTVELRYCNCAECECLLLGDSHAPWYARLSAKEQGKLPPLVFTRVKGRPYCITCGMRSLPPPLPATREDDGSPWQQNAVREMEDGR